MPSPVFASYSRVGFVWKSKSNSQEIIERERETDPNCLYFNYQLITTNAKNIETFWPTCHRPMGCTSSAPAKKYAPPATASGAASAAGASPSGVATGTPKASPKASGGSGPSGPGGPGARVVEETDVPTVNNSGVARVMPEGLLSDADGDEAHEFFVEDPRTGEMRKVVTKDLKQVPWALRGGKNWVWRRRGRCLWIETAAAKWWVELPDAEFQLKLKTKMIWHLLQLEIVVLIVMLAQDISVQPLLLIVFNAPCLQHLHVGCFTDQ